MVESSLKGLKTLWEKEKLLVTSNFSFSLSVFKRLILQTRKNQGLFGKGLNSDRFLSKRLDLTNKRYRNIIRLHIVGDLILVYAIFRFAKNVWRFSYPFCGSTEKLPVFPENNFGFVTRKSFILKALILVKIAPWT